MSQFPVKSSATAAQFNSKSPSPSAMISPDSKLVELSEGKASLDLDSLHEKLSSLDLVEWHGEGDGEDAAESSDEDEATQKPFDLAQCLFCNQQSNGFVENMSHMQMRHGLVIPSPDNLIVDLETLVGYFHLVIFEYTECLCCGSVRSTPQGAQQHMTGKGHCRIDIARENSEFKDFYDFKASSEMEGEEWTDGAADRVVDASESTRRLASGKVISHRSANKIPLYRPVGQTNNKKALSEEKHPPIMGKSHSLTSGSNNEKALTASEKRDMVFSKQLAKMRAGDRQALMHLTIPQRIALVGRAKHQQEKWDRQQAAQKIKWQIKANP
ncbi:hypothetical protein QQS21_007583 [Conoideocrella luteorostrata]|uniref:ZN622/Rei1/Reh1 zinc finger C2H2-type domain-containing protein n=1 Tax=Conoideocrella luteorostrata TaxID=1105319 RepID=A0AAJ0FXA1_9HYPO|nr:hypothetical protein QQS21_007583 [Conoideocrella luteorostrata]